MAFYKHDQFLQASSDRVFDDPFRPGAPTPFPGIYRCAACGREVASLEGTPLPPANHHQHPGIAPITWQLVATIRDD